MPASDVPSVPDERFDRFVDPVDGSVWRVDLGFLGSSWRCIWGEGCEGILEHRAADLQQGCCSRGCELIDDEEAMTVAALAATLEPDRFQHHDVAAVDSVFADPDRRHTRLVDDACIFLNRPGFSGGEGCALHLGALDAGESPTTWKPSICWQLPLKVDTADDGVRTLRRWARADWDDDESQIAWCCTEEPEPYVGEVPVALSLADELEGIVGPEVGQAIRSRVSARPEKSP